LDAADFDLLLSQLTPDRPPLARLAAAQALRDAKLDDAQLTRLTPAIPTAGALELPHLLAAFEHGHSAATGAALVESLKSCKGLSSLPADALRGALKPYPPEIQQSAAPLLARLDAGLAEQRAKLADLQPLLNSGDPRVGRNVFFSKTAACSTCHTVQGQGGRVGPDLSHIASIRTQEDLLEAIVFPSASFARGYEPYTIKTKDNQLHAGVISRETADAVYLATPTEERIARSDIQRITPSQISVMPQGLDAALSRQELADLIAFLKSLK
jgi:putative heme-binding domain-containing protein